MFTLLSSRCGNPTGFSASANTSHGQNGQYSAETVGCYGKQHLMFRSVMSVTAGCQNERRTVINNLVALGTLRHT